MARKMIHIHITNHWTRANKRLSNLSQDRCVRSIQLQKGLQKIWSKTDREWFGRLWRKICSSGERRRRVRRFSDTICRRELLHRWPASTRQPWRRREVFLACGCDPPSGRFASEPCPRRRLPARPTRRKFASGRTRREKLETFGRTLATFFQRFCDAHQCRRRLRSSRSTASSRWPYRKSFDRFSDYTVFAIALSAKSSTTIWIVEDKMTNQIINLLGTYIQMVIFHTDTGNT